MKVLIAVATPFLALGLLATAHAASPSQQDCEAQGGTFSKTNGQVSCVVVTEENVGKSPNSQTTTNETDTTGQGNIGNKQEQTNECAGPGNSTSSSHCP